MERRIRERREHSSFVWKERRYGFDRRDHRPVTELLRTMTENRWTLLFLLGLNIMNFVDWVETQAALKLGATEANPLMASLISWNPVMAGYLKIGLFAAISVLIWRYRKHRGVAATLLLGYILYLGVIVMHLRWMLNVS